MKDVLDVAKLGSYQYPIPRFVRSTYAPTIITA